MGDYVAKGIATFLEKKNPGTHLINRLKETDPNANPLQKFWNWAKHTSLKSSDELGTIKDKRLRTLCQVGNIVFSLLSLGLFIPLYTRSKTNKKRAEELAKLNAENAEKGGTSSASQVSSTTLEKEVNGSSKSTTATFDFSKNRLQDNKTFKAFMNS